jgi:trehalose 6-phosphate synthase/phosphatase
MHIVSYRGPGQAGGVSAALERAWDSNLSTGSLWWHVDNNSLKVSRGPGAVSTDIANIPQDVIKGHYRFCNDFLWPVMHDLPEYATYDHEDRLLYDSFNQTYGWCLIRSHSAGLPAGFFVQDYQLALLPGFLREHAGFRSLVFWHIPWPKTVMPEHAQFLVEMVRSLLKSEAIGFHTQEYAANFLQFVREHMREYVCDDGTLSISSETSLARIHPARRIASDSYRFARSQQSVRKHVTRLIVAPLGIDFEHWNSLATTQQNNVFHPSLARTPFILSVDRADYTKGVTDRIKAIDLFFERHPDFVGKVVFAQISGKTRPGLQAFDAYWGDCQRLYENLANRWATETWQPLTWIESSFSSAELAVVYRNAEVMLVNAVRDGLNLTAKEYVACQTRRKPGALALSSGTGAWHELGKHAVALEPRDPSQIADGIYSALSMDSHERAWRMALLREQVKSNPLGRWWHTFASLLERHSDKVLLETS